VPEEEAMSEPQSAYSFDPTSEVPGARAVEVAALLGDSLVGVRHVSDPRGGALRRGTLALFAAGALLLCTAALAFAVGVRSARADQLARERWIEVEGRPAWEFRPARLSALGDVAAVGGLLGGLACIAWALARSRRDREPGAVTIGHGAGTDFAAGELGGERFALVAPRGDGFVLRVPAGAAVEPAIAGRGPDGAIETPLEAGARFRIAAGQLGFVVAAVNAPRRHAAGGKLETRVLAFAGGSALAHLALLALVHSIAPDSKSLHDDPIAGELRLVSVKSAALEDAREPPPEPGAAGEVGGPDGAATEGAEGKMGSKESTAAAGRFQHQKRSEEQQLARPSKDEVRAAAREAGILGLARANPQYFTGLTSTSEFSSGIDDRMVYGGHVGEIGEMAGGWGYGVYGFGPGAGGKNGQSIAVGEYGLTGPGGDGGDRVGYGTCKPGQTCGTGLRGHQGKVPPPRIGPVASDGFLDKQIIRQHIRKKLPMIKHCYERALIAAPGLGGTSVAQFQISPQGKVQGSTVRGLNAEVDGCIADVISTIEFPAPKNGGYVNVSSYPFTFVNPGS
jgi:hypothetical protein